MPLIQKPKQSDMPLDKSAGAPRLVKRLHLAGRLITIYGFLWLLVFGYQYAIVDEKPYAQMGLVTFAVMLILCGGWLSGIYSRWYAAKTEGELFAAFRVTYAGALPTGFIAFVMQCVLVSCMVTQDSYTTLEVKATEPVKAELRWLLGDIYPDDQESNIDHQSLRWMLNTDGPTTFVQDSFLRAHSSAASKQNRKFYDRQLNDQSFSIELKEGNEKKGIALAPEWSKAKIFGSYFSDGGHNYPICELKVPANLQVLQWKNHSVLINERLADSILSDPEIFRHPRPNTLPPIIKLTDDHIILRTNFIGSAWSIYCAINYSADKANIHVEPLTELSLGDLNKSRFQLHFLLFPNLRENIKHFEVKQFHRASSYDEFIGKLNRLVAFDVLKTQIREITSSPLY